MYSVGFDIAFQIVAGDTYVTNGNVCIDTLITPKIHNNNNNNCNSSKTWNINMFSLN